MAVKKIELDRDEAIEAVDNAINILRKAEGKVSEQEIRYRGLLAYLDVGIIVCAPDASIITANHKASELLGISESQLKGKLPNELQWKFIDEADTPLPLKEYPINQILASKKPIKNQLRGINRPVFNDIVWVMVNGFPVLGKNGQISEIVISFMDVTSQKNAEEKLGEKSEKLRMNSEQLTATNEELRATNEEMEATNEELRATSEDLSNSKMVLNASELRYRRLFETANDGILILDFNSGMIMDVNPFLVKLLGYSKKVFLNKHLWEVGVFKDIAASKRSFLQLKSKNYVRYEDLPLETRGGKKIDAEFISNVYTIGGEKIIQCNVRDIRERRMLSASEEEYKSQILSASEERYRSLFNHMKFEAFMHCELVYDKKGKPVDYRFLEVNSAYERITGQKAGRVIGKTAKQLFPKLEKSWFERYFKVALTGKSIHFEDYLKDLDKYYDVISYSPKKGQFVNTFFDVTERKKAEEQLRSSAHYNRNLIESSLDPLVTIGSDGKITDVNIATEKATGLSRKNLIGTNFSSYFTEPKKADAGYRKVFSNGFVKDYPLTLRHKSGSCIDVSYNAILYKNESGKVIGVFAAARDITALKKAEVAMWESKERLESKTIGSLLKNSEERYTATISAVNDGIWDWNVKTGNAFFSSIYYKILGYKNNEFTANYAEWRKLVHPDDVEGVERILQHSIKTGKKFNIDLRMKTKSGAWQWVSTRGNAIEKDASGAATRMVGVLADITERKKAEEQLRQRSEQLTATNEELRATSEEMGATNEELKATSEELSRSEKVLSASELRYRRLFETANDGILILDFNSGMIMDVNPFLVKLLGYSKKVFLNKHLWEVGIFKDIAASKKGFLKLKSKNYSRYEDLPLETKGGKKIDVEFLSSVYPVGGKKVIQCNIRDITERNLAEEALHESEEKFSTIFKNSPNTIIITRAMDGKILGVNDAFTSLSGFTRKEAMLNSSIGLNLWENVKDRNGVLADLKNGKEVKDREFTFRIKNNKLIICLFSAQIIHIAGEPVILSSILDITSRKNAEDAIKNQSKLLEEMVEERTRKLQEQMKKVDDLAKVKDEFIRNVSHELKTPLSVIKGNLFLLRDNTAIGKDAELGALIKILDRNSERIGHSINQILQLSRLSEVDIKRTSFNLDAVVGDIYKEYLALAKMKGIKMFLNANPVIIMGDMELLRLAISNLVGNAIKFTGKGSVRITLSAKKGMALITIHDTGIGMPKEVMGHLFEKFFKADPSAPGTGIGLSIANEIIEKHKGAISVKSNPGKGSTFELAIPLGEHK